MGAWAGVCMRRADRLPPPPWMCHRALGEKTRRGQGSTDAYWRAAVQYAKRRNSGRLRAMARNGVAYQARVTYAGRVHVRTSTAEPEHRENGATNHSTHAAPGSTGLRGSNPPVYASGVTASCSATLNCLLWALLSRHAMTDGAPRPDLSLAIAWGPCPSVPQATRAYPADARGQNGDASPLYQQDRTGSAQYCRAAAGSPGTCLGDSQRLLACMGGYADASGSSHLL